MVLPWDSMQLSGFYPTLLHRLIYFNGSHIRQKCNGACPLDCMGEGALMPRTATRQSSGDDFATLGYEIPEHFGVLIVYREVAIGTEPADFSTMVDSLLSFGALTITLAV
jgi:hypothetical protein